VSVLTVATAADLAPHVGREIGTSAWHTIEAPTILGFAELTNERHWLHTDRERVQRETPFPDIVAHGFLTLAMLTSMAGEIVRIEHATRILNYGIDRLRFTEIVTAGDRVRLRLALGDHTTTDDGSTRLTWRATMEIDRKTRPALVCDFLWLVLPERR
jgi:acyl dehydratase